MERLCKLYAIEDISKDEKQKLYNLIVEKIESNTETEVQEIQARINEVFNGNLENLGNLEKLVQEEGLNDNCKTACLRVFKTRAEKEILNQEKRNEITKKLEAEYGEEATKKYKDSSKNLLHWECIEQVRDNKQEIAKLHNPMEYLKAKDLRAFKIVIAHVPDDIKTENENLKMLIEKRKNASGKEVLKYNDLCCIELEREFGEFLATNEEVLERLNVNVLPNGYKHRTKDNGYIADHIKFGYRDHPEYTFELQLRSIYREMISRANGSAAHDKRSGKKRIFPDTSNNKQFMAELNNMVPQYTVLKNGEKGYYAEKCSILESMLEYYLGYIDTNSQEYKKALEYLSKENTKTY